MNAAMPTTPPPEPPYDAAADSIGSWRHAVAGVRLQRVIAGAFESYMAAARERPGLTVSAWVAGEIVRKCPRVLDAVGGKG
jgi:hypothetical protein